MSFHIIGHAGKTAYGVKEFIVDTYADVEKMNLKKLSPGSTIFVIDASEYYMLNTKKEWIKVNINNGNGGNLPGGGETSPEEIEVVYDGGELNK